MALTTDPTKEHTDELGVALASGQVNGRCAPGGPGGAGRAPSAYRAEPLPRTPAPLHLLAIGTYLAVSLAWWAHVWFGGNPAHAITCNCGDTTEQVWWLEWLPWAISHGHNPFLTNTIWARFGGVNAMSNTSWMAPAAILAPVTALFGPVASFNVANLLAPVVSGWAAFTLAGYVSRRTGPRLLAGGLYAFSPFILRNTVLGHIDLTVAAYLPLVLLLGLRLLHGTARPVRVGVWLGVLTIVQFFTGLELLAITFVTTTLCALGVLVWRPQLIVAARRNLVVAAAVGAVLAGAVLAYPTWYFLAGPRHVVGPFWPVASSSPQGIINAGVNVFSTHTGLSGVGYLGAQGPDTDFLGWGLLVFVALSSPVWARRRGCRVLAVVAVACWILEFVPAVAWEKVPLLSSVQEVRFALPLSLCVGLLLGASIDGWWSLALRRWPAPGAAARRRAARLVTLALVAAAFVPLLDTYSVPFRVTDTTVPLWFARDAGRLAPGTAVLTLPFAYGIASTPMAWQAETHNSFDLMGGWALVPGGNGANDETVSPMGGAVAALRAFSHHPRRVTDAQVATVRAALARWRPLVVVVIPRYAPAGTVATLTSTLGFAPTWSDGAWVWHVGPTTHLGPASAMRTA